MSRRSKSRNAATSSRSESAVVHGGMNGGHYRPLKHTDVERIVDAAMTVLERTGIELAPSQCRDVLLKAGCTVDASSDRILMPRKVIEQGLSTAAKEVLLAGRSPEHDLQLGGTRVYMGTGGSAINIVDLDGALRETTLVDNYNIGRLVDKLEHIHFYMRPVVSREIPVENLDINQYYACMSATKKHVMANAYERKNVADIRQMGDMMVGGADAFDARPPMSFVACWTVSPLRYAEETVDVVDGIVEHKMPLVLSSAPQSGATSPAALAGSLVQIWAEQLSGVAYVNLLNPGHPVIVGCVPAQADLRTGSYTGSSAESSVMNAACAQIAQHLKLPIYNSAGIAESKTSDSQAGIEKMLTSLAAGLSGANYIHHSAGFLESMLTVSFAQYVIDNEVNGQVMRMVRGIDMSEEALSIDVIDTACRTDGHFLNQPQTMDLMKTEYLYPELMNRSSRADWEAEGSLDLRQAATRRAELILSENWPDVIPDDVDAEIRKRFEILLPREAMRP